ncbi:hypothetical protein OSB04_008120 [Centaurea solstitialis]|uniref:Pectinesterase n=1 Tax=Centaurea solstitialis TaxID=347529 RepID=A0AA38TXT8_9ASTR|nr:hypothetical protein OSB04_008120 [Centaurea solstitialis]
MLVRTSIDDALVVCARVHEIEAKYPNAPGKSSWSSCVHYFDMIVFTLNKIFDNTLEPTQLDIQTWLSVSLTYIDVCEKGFELVNIMTNAILPFVSNNLRKLITNSLATSALNRVSKNPMFVHWNMRNEYMLSDNLATKRPDVVVAKDGSGNYRTVQHAVNAASKLAKPKSKFVIYVKSGVYTENVMILQTVSYITMYGDGINKTIITGSRSLGGRITELKHTTTFPLRDTKTHSMRLQIDNSTKNVRSLDFIFGNALAVFQDCEIFLRKPRDRGGLVVTAQGRTRENEPTGFAFQDYNNHGPRASTAKRVKWLGFHNIKDRETAEPYTIAKFISGNNWLPKTGAPYICGTVQDAVSAASKLAKPNTRFVIYVKSGVYTENVMILVPYITTYEEEVWGDEFMAQDMTFRNTVGPDAGHEVAFFSDSDHSAFYHCSFEGYQDTLYAFGKSQFYKECEDLKPVLSQYNKAFLGRPWRPHALTAYMESYFDDIVDPQGWLDTWGFNEACFLGEFDFITNRRGSLHTFLHPILVSNLIKSQGMSTLRRVKWPSFHNITDRKTAEPYTVAQFFQGDNWVPKTGVPYIHGFENNQHKIKY